MKSTPVGFLSIVDIMCCVVVRGRDRIAIPGKFVANFLALVLCHTSIIFPCTTSLYSELTFNVLYFKIIVNNLELSQILAKLYSDLSDS